MRSVTVASIASPFQAMSLMEAVTAGAVRHPDIVIAHGPLQQIHAVLALADPALGRAATVRRPRRQHLELLSRADEIVLGDPFSRIAQMAMLARIRGRIVILEDGAAVLGAWRTLSTDGAALGRAHSRRQLAGALSRLATRRLRRLADNADVTLVAGLPMPAEIAERLQARSFGVIPHDFGWSSTVTLPTDERLPATGGGRHVVLGSALAADGHLGLRHYRDWLAEKVVPGTVFLPHRRDQPAEIELANRCGALIVPPHHLTAELLLRDVDGELVVDSFPMTAALTITAVRRTSPTTMRVTRLPTGWWSPHSPSSMLDLVNEIADLAVPVNGPTETATGASSTSTVVDP